VCFSQPKNLKRIITQKNERKHSDKNEKAKTMGDNIQVCFSQPKNLKRIITQKNERKHSDKN
jgi:hypothetical protein